MQSVCDLLLSAGLVNILNFPVLRGLSVPNWGRQSGLNGSSPLNFAELNCGFKQRQGFTHKVTVCSNREPFPWWLGALYSMLAAVKTVLISVCFRMASLHGQTSCFTIAAQVARTLYWKFVGGSCNGIEHGKLWMRRWWGVCGNKAFGGDR